MRRSVLALVALLAAASPLSAQSLFATRGLGVPISPVDGRARALGGIGIGLLGLNPSLANPAEVAGIGRRGIAAALQPSVRTMELEGAEDDVTATRFPLIRVLYPLGSRAVAHVGYGGFLDQSWAVIAERPQQFGSDTVTARDIFDSDGGIAQLQVGVAYLLTPRLALGLAGGLYTGDLQRNVSRIFPDTTSPGLRPFDTRFGWSYRAPLASAGVRWDLGTTARLGASVTWAGELKVDSTDGPARSRKLDLPLQLAGGASAYLGPNLIAAVSARWAGWSVAEEGLAPTTGAVLPGGAAAAADTWEVGGGLEFEGARAFGRRFPFRLGWHRAQFPFRFNGEVPNESAFTAGVGARLAEAGGSPLAVADLSVERGARGDAAKTGLTENFWRATISLVLFGR